MNTDHDPSSPYWVCPVCGEFFGNDQCADDPIWHCLECDHHYPADGSDDEPECHNCAAELRGHGVTAVPTTLSVVWLDRLCAWSESRGFKRGMGTIYFPDGSVVEGGILVRGPRR